MGDYQSSFRRYEIKFLLNAAQRRRLEALIQTRMSPDVHGESLVYSLYCDTPDYRLIRRSLEKPVYKEKLRLRSYGQAGPEDEVFLELKKKYKGVVYKRRIAVPETAAMAALEAGALPGTAQINRELDACLRFYATLAPRMFLSYRRDAYYAQEDPGLRVTFDRDILWRETGLTLDSAPAGKPLLEKGQSLLELKTAGAIPLWIAAELTALGLYKTSFSKYGGAFRSLMNSKQEDQQWTEHSLPVFFQAAQRLA